MTKYIMEVERGGRQCLLVRVPGQSQKLFRPEDYTSPEKMREAAEEYRDMLRSAKIPLPLQRDAKPNSSSGVAGVRRKEMRPGEWSWFAEWFPEPNKSKKKFFSVRKYGEVEAKRLAIEERTKQVELLNGRKKDGDPS